MIANHKSEFLTLIYHGPKQSTSARVGRPDNGYGTVVVRAKVRSS